MNLLYLILPLALLIVAGFVAAFVWAARKGQFDDLETPAMRALFDDSEVVKEPASENRDQ
jgi:cbb3-type cytochrome oxidase maturation protein